MYLLKLLLYTGKTTVITWFKFLKLLLYNNIFNECLLKKYYSNKGLKAILKILFL
jgi:hypothetical protein